MIIRAISRVMASGNPFATGPQSSPHSLGSLSKVRLLLIDNVEAAYLRSDLFDRWLYLMNEWAASCLAPSPDQDAA